MTIVIRTFILMVSGVLFFTKSPFKLYNKEKPVIVNHIEDHKNSIRYVVDGNNVNADLAGEAQSFVVENNFIFGFSSHGKYENGTDEDTLHFVCNVPYKFPAPAYISTFANSYGMIGCTYSHKLMYTPMIFFAAYASGPQKKLGSVTILEFSLLKAETLTDGSKMGTYRIVGDFDLNNAVIISASASERCQEESDRRMSQDIYPWYDPTCVATEKKLIINGHFDLETKMPL